MNELQATSAINKNGDKVIQIRFPFDFDLLEKVRTLPGRRWHSEAKCWSAPIFTETLIQLKGWGFSLDRKLQRHLEKVNTVTYKIKSVKIPGLKGTLYPYQNAGVAFIESNRGRALIGDVMGLGKTVQALAWLQLQPKKRPVIIVTPASLKLNWAREAHRWLPTPKVEILMGKTPWKPKGSLIIINYDILPEWVDTLHKLHPKVLITDECHFYKNNHAKRTKAIKKLGKGIPHIIALSGTPIENRPIEMFNAIKLIDPNLFPDYWLYMKRYCNAKRTRFGWDFSGSSNSEELHQKLKASIMIRRRKEDVLPDLPPKVRSFIPLQINNEADYKAAEHDFISFITETRGDKAARKAEQAETLTQIEVLKQLSVQGKLQEVISWIEDFLEVEDKLVVFTTHRFTVEALMQKFGKTAVRLDGSVSSMDRQGVIDAFQNDPKIKLFVGNMKAAGVGITLTAASNIAIIELPWTPGALEQAEDRCHRIGQKNVVNIYYLLATGTIEEAIADLLDKKRKVLDAVLDGKITEQESLLSELIKQYLHDTH